MEWISDLASLPTIVAILVVFTVCLWWILRIMTTQIIDPFKMVMTNHMEHERQFHVEQRIERKREVEAIDRLVEKIDTLIQK